MKQYCDKCGMLLDENYYYLTNNFVKYPTGRMTTCKKCVTMNIKNLNPETFFPILEDIDVPYIHSEWEYLVTRAFKRVMLEGGTINGMTVLGKYLARMRAPCWKNLRWKDSPHLQGKGD